MEGDSDEEDVESDGEYRDGSEGNDYEEYEQSIDINVHHVQEEREHIDFNNDDDDSFDY